MLSSVALRTDVAAGRVEYPRNVGSRCTVSTRALPAFICTFSAIPALGVFPDKVSVSKATCLRATAREGLLLIEDGRGVISLGSGQGRLSEISDILA